MFSMNRISLFLMMAWADANADPDWSVCLRNRLMKFSWYLVCMPW